MEIAVALNTANKNEALSIINKLKEEADLFKIGIPLFTGYGLSLVRELLDEGIRVFLDLKLFDIPDVVAKTVDVISRMDIDLLTVSALGGYEMMARAKEVAGNIKLIGVTILTSIGRNYLKEKMGIDIPMDELVLRLAREAKKAGLDGVVASGEELKLLRKEMGEDFLIVVPGVRLESDERGDQKRIITPEKAKKWGADIIVVGRPITDSKDPLAKLKEYRVKMKGGKYGS